MSKAEQTTIAAYVSAEYDKLLFQQPTTYVSMNAQADPEHWQNGMRELIASDPKRVREIIDAAHSRSGFTLIEMSIVLVIIGLIVGGVLVGQSLINAAGVRATITQIEKYNTAANTFKEKTGYLPGDINAQAAAQFGFAARGSGVGQGDGNGVIVQVGGNGIGQMGGETVMFWSDLSYANGMNLNLIPGSFSAATSSCPSAHPDCANVYTGASLYSFLNTVIPQAALGGGNYVYVWSGGPNQGASGANGINYFGLSNIFELVDGGIAGMPGLTVAQAQAIDAKIDDGLPQTGNVQTVIPWQGWGQVAYWVTGGGRQPPWNTSSSVSPSATTCSDNNGNASNPWEYSMSQNGGAGVNCALSFKMQAGD